ncbi:MAG: efflux RND transporter permease subunit [Acidobacteriota bacterium]
MGLIAFSLRRRVTVFMVAVAVVVFGAVAFTRLPINLLPDISYPSLTVETRLPGAAPAEVESLVSRPIEEAVGVVAGVRRISSVSRPGLSQVTLEFAWDRDMDFASIDVREKLDLVILPRLADKPVLLRSDPSNDPVVRLYITGSESLYQLRYVAEEVIKKDLESTTGVAAIRVHGGYEEAIEIQLDQGKLSLLGLGIEDVNRRLQQDNVNQAGGSLYESEARYLVRSRNEFRNLRDIRDTVLASRDGRDIILGDVARVARGHKPREVIARFRGKEAVELAVYKAGDANTVSVSRAIFRRLQGMRGELPEGIHVATGLDQSRFIQASIDEVISNAIMGGLIAMVVLMLFLKNPLSTLIIGISIPLSVIATFFLMYQTGTTLNVMSLGGLALGVGMLVDNAIVVLESIHKRRERGESPQAASLGGASEVGRAVIAATLTTIAVFVPVVFVQGVAAQLFRDQAITVSFSLLASLGAALTLIPMMAALVRDRGRPGAAGPPPADRPRQTWPRRVLRAIGLRAPALLLYGLRRGVVSLGRLLAVLVRPLSRSFDHLLDLLTRVYPRVLARALRARALVVSVAVLALIGSMVLMSHLGLDLIPSFSQGEFSFLVELPEGTPLGSTDRFIHKAQAVLKDDPRVSAYSSVVGGAGLSLTRTGTEGENVARIQVRMKSGTTQKDEEAVADRLRRSLEESKSARAKFERPSYFTLQTPIAVEIYGDDLEELKDAADVLRRRIARIPGIVDLESSAALGNPEVQVTFHRDQLSRLGLNLSQVASTVRNKIQGEMATRFLEGDREIDILVRSVEVGQASIRDVDDLIIGQRDGVPLYLKAVADVKLATGPGEIRRIGQKRAAVITGDLSGRDMGAVASDVRDAIHATVLPAGVTAGLSGQQEELERSFNSLLMAMGLAVFLVYLVMASQFESLLHPFVVMFTVPLGAIGAIAALGLTGNSVNIVALIGAVMLAGIVVNNAIVLVDNVNQHRARGLGKHEALIQGGLHRLRPILMTSSTTILGLMPMALGLGEGAELRAPLAITVIGGLTVATLLTLIVIPVVYDLLDRKDFHLAAADEASIAAGRPETGRMIRGEAVEPAQ